VLRLIRSGFRVKELEDYPHTLFLQFANGRKEAAAVQGKETGRTQRLLAAVTFQAVNGSIRIDNCHFLFFYKACLSIPSSRLVSSLGTAATNKHIRQTN